MKRKGKQGFTLAELLIVVAIIAVLVAVAIPVFSTQLEKSREAVDISNIRSAIAEVTAAALTERNATGYRGNLSFEGNYTPAGGTEGAAFQYEFPTEQHTPGWQGSAPEFSGNVTVTNAPIAKNGLVSIYYMLDTDKIYIVFDN